jgi:uncharacterized protein (UPF0332 family)
MDGRDFLEVADDLITAMREADWRSAVSRAYYASFHVARQLLQDCGFQVPIADKAHAYLWRRLSNGGHADLQHAGQDLNALRTARNWADYDLDRPLDQATAVDKAQNASDIIDLLRSVPTLPATQAQLTEAIKTYERDVLREETWRQ